MVTKFKASFHSALFFSDMKIKHAMFGNRLIVQFWPRRQYRFYQRAHIHKMRKYLNKIYVKLFLLNLTKCFEIKIFENMKLNYINAISRNE